MIQKTTLFIFLLIGFSFSINSQNTTLTNADPFCSDTGLTFSNTSGAGSAEVGPDYGCLSQQPNPAWFLIKIDQTGDLALQIEQNANSTFTGTQLDVDFIAWGPFTLVELTTIQGGDYSYLSATNQVGCSFSNAPIENLNVPNAQAGDYYVILITNYSDQPGFIRMISTNIGDPNAGSTDCSIVETALGPDQDICDGTVVTLDATPTTGVATAYKWFLDTGTGFNEIIGQTNATLIINTNISGTYKVEVTDDQNNTAEDQVIITFHPLPLATQPPNFLYCDDNNDGFYNFNFQTNKTSEILNGQDPTIFEVLYFISQADADTNTNAITNPYTNTTAYGLQTIYVRVHNITAPDACFATTTFNILVSANPHPTQPTEYRLCDDVSVGTDTDGFINHFLLNTKDTEILGALDPATYSVSYHTTLVGAQTDNTTDVIDKNNGYTNIVTNSQTIYVRVENTNNTACNNTSLSFNLVVSPLPVITSNVDLKQCDNDVDGFSDFNLTEANILISADYLNETFVYFPSLADAQNNTNPIANPLVFTNRVQPIDTLWARVYTVHGCHRIAQINLIVSVTGIPAGFSRSFNVCDDFLDINGNNNVANSDTDGIASFNFSSVTADVESALGNPANIIITYYRNEADALAEQNAITDITNYRNIGYPNSQIIYIRVDSTLDNACLGFGPYITLTVDPVPVANPVNNLELCDDLDDGDGTNGIVQSFDLESQAASILGTQDPANYTVTYHLSAAEANNGNNPLASPFTNTTPNRQTIYVRVTHNAGGCFTDHTSFDLIVNPLPIANFVPDIHVCDDDTDGSARNGFSQIINLESNTAGVLGAQDPALFSVTYHRSLADAQAGIRPLLSPYSNVTPFTETIYVRVYNADTGCANGISNFNVIVDPEPIPNPQNTLSNLSYCDDDNAGLGDDTDGIVENIDLDSQIPDILGPDNTAPNYQDPDDFIVTFHHAQIEATDGTNPIESPYTNTNLTETIFVRIQNKATGCINDNLTFQLIINTLPDFSVSSPQIVCLNILPKTLEIENPAEVYTYLWTDEAGTVLGTATSLEVTTGGLYSVTASKTDGTNCTKTHKIQVNESIIASLVDADVTIVDDSDNNTITIDNVNQHLGIGIYEYALTDERGNFIRFYQDEPIFENLEGNIYNILVRDKNGCGTAELLVPVVQFPKFFSPNGDGINDTWVTKGVNKTFFPISEIYIFNRFGKVVAKIPIDGNGWDGTYNGKILSSDDYWYSIKLVDKNGIKRERKGHFSLLRK